MAAPAAMAGGPTTTGWPARPAWVPVPALAARVARVVRRVPCRVRTARAAYPVPAATAAVGAVTSAARPGGATLRRTAAPARSVCVAAAAVVAVVVVDTTPCSRSARATVVAVAAVAVAPDSAAVGAVAAADRSACTSTRIRRSPSRATRSRPAPAARAATPAQGARAAEVAPAASAGQPTRRRWAPAAMAPVGPRAVMVARAAAAAEARGVAPRLPTLGSAGAPEVDAHNRSKRRRRPLQAHRDLNARPHRDRLIEHDAEAQGEELEGFGLRIGLAGDVVFELRAGADHGEPRARNHPRRSLHGGQNAEAETE